MGPRLLDVYHPFFFNDTATTEIYTLSLHDALPIYRGGLDHGATADVAGVDHGPRSDRSEEHTSELQSHSDLVCRLLLEKKKRRRADARHHRPGACRVVVRGQRRRAGRHHEGEPGVT